MATVLSLALGLWRLGDKPLWIDEGISWSRTEIEFGRLLSVSLRTEPHLTLYYVVMKLVSVLGSSEVVLRSLSVAAVAATVPFAYGIAVELWSRRAGVLAAVFVAINGFLVQYAQEARPYALAAFLSTASSYLFVVGFRRQRRGLLLAWAGVSILAVFAHLFAAFVILAQLLSIPLLPDKMVSRRVLVWCGAAGAAAAVPLIALLIRGNKAAGIWWILPVRTDGVIAALTQMAGGGGRLLLVAHVAAGALAIAAAVSARGRTWEWWGVSLVLRWAVVPVAGAILVSQIQPIFVARYLIVAVPAFAVLAAAGLASIRSTPAFIAAVALFVALAIPGITEWYGSNDKEDWRSAAAFVAAEAEEGDAVIVYRFGRSSFRYYLGRASSESSPSLTVVGGDRLAGERLDRLLDGHDRVWLVWFQQAGTESGWQQLAQAIGNGRQVTRTAGFHLIATWLYDRP